MGNRPSTYELISRAFDFVHDLNESGGETDDDFDAALDAFLDESDDKIAAIRSVVQRFGAEEEILQTEIKRLQDRKKSISNRKATLKASALELVKAAIMLPNAPIDRKNDRRLNFDTYSVSVSVSRSVAIEDEDAFIHRNRESPLVRTKLSVDRTAVKSALSKGEIKGARLVDSEGLRWS